MMAYSPRTQPRTHQAEALRRMAGKDAFALLMAMRVGKSKVIVDEWGAAVAADELDDLLIVAPAGAYRGWDLDKGPDQPGELRKHLDIALHRRTAIAAWVSGNRLSKKTCEALLEDVDRPRVLVANVEAFSRDTGAYKICAEFLRQRRAMMVVDESTSVRNMTERTKNVLKLGALAKRRRIMSGLPTPKSPLDLWAQFYFLDWNILGHRTFSTFRARYAIVERQCMLPTSALAERLGRYAGGSWQVPGVGRVSVEDLNRQGLLEELERRRIYVPVVPLIKGYRNEDELREKIAPYSYRVTLDDVRAASPTVYQIREVELTAEQKRIYREIKEFATSEIEAGAHVTATAVIAQILRLHQVVCGHVADEIGVVHDIAENRTKALLETLEEYDGKALIWCSYDRDVRKVTAALEKEYGAGSVARFWGGNRNTREDEEARFKGDAACRWMVATAAAGGRGRTWSVADLAIFYSNGYDLETRMQAEERTEGVTKYIGATRIDLVASGTVDEKIIDVLRKKIDLASAITGDNYKQWLV